MTLFLVPVILILMGLTVWSLLRGIGAFLNSTKAELEGDGTRATEMQLLQNKMMFNRIKYQGLAVAVVAILLLFTHGGR
ncbi:MAG: HIG1 domain-containing protein [Novosphingobium sp.]|uniref:HIG1 domain-containing protein n=1 Tax=unclassified Novosphingobium TaxID=2644732 RepID=UPI0006B8F548|nr:MULTISPECIES: HIG1 domain-containing protein [unclassified Novosphingobium]KPF78116.1 glutamyl-tRNA synthetase [Novosphingobium sp. AAP93]MBY0393810.1 HIG1 domain-containing protein [Novosphingobium sp.]